MMSILRKSLLTFIIMLILTSQLLGQGVQITILHTNDLHAQFDPLPSSSSKMEARTNSGGFIALNHLLTVERNNKTLILDGGDLFTGTLLSKMSVGDVKGGALIRLMNKMDYDAMVLGNHDFDNGLEALKKCVQMAKFDMLSANIFQKDSLLTGKAYQIYQKGDIRIGVIGLTTQRLSHLVPHSILDDVKIENAAETAREWIQKIDPQTDLIILLTHQGRSADSLLATKIHGADIIVGGHSHTLLQKPLEVSGALITQAGSRCQFLGKLDVWVEADAISKYQYQLIPLVPMEGEDKSEFGLLVDEYKNRIDEEFGQVIGKLKIPWKRSRNQESNVGNFVSDVMRQKTKADFAVVNSGAIRKNLNAGPIQTRDIYDLLPFKNRLAVFQCTGNELLTLMLANAKILNKPYDDMLQISGISYVVGKKENGKIKLIHPRINGRAIKSNQLYTGVTVDYILDGHAKSYLGFVPKQVEILDYELAETVIEAIQKKNKIQSEIQRRIR